jgi:WD40 repeat protein
MIHKLTWLIILVLGIFNLALADTVGPIRSMSGHHDWVKSIAISPDGRYALSGSYDDTMKLWDVSSGAEIRTFKGHTSDIESVAFSPDGHYALYGSEDNTMKLWDVSSGAEIRTFKGHTSNIESISFSPDGRYALSASLDFTIKLWEVSSGDEIRTFKGHSYFVISVFFSPDGRYALSGSWDKTMKLWDVSSGAEIRTFKGHTSYITSVSLSPDGRYALSGSWDKTMKLWDVSSGAEIRTFKGHNDYISSVAFSPDGRYAISGSLEKFTIKLWDVSSGDEICTFKGHSDAVSSVAFSPDGHYLFSGSWDKTLKVWNSGISINQPPKASFRMNPNIGFAPLTVQLDASTSTDNGNIVQYQWTSSDGQTAEGIQTSLTFSQVGTHNITLTVTDNEGATATQTQSITVNNPPTTKESDKAQIEFEGLKEFYKVGDILSVDLVQKVQTNRFQRLDLWVMIEMPNGQLIYRTQLAFVPFSLEPQAFKKSLESSNRRQRILDLEIPPGLGGTYVFYAVYIKEGSNLKQDGITVQRSNMARKQTTLADQ